MATTSYFKSEDKLKDKFDYHAWKMTLDLTLEENDVMNYVQGKAVDPVENLEVPPLFPAHSPLHHALPNSSPKSSSMHDSHICP